MENTKSNFLEEIIKYKPIFFHWLDGFIKKDIGNTISNTFNLISETIGPLCTNKDITIGNIIKANIINKTNDTIINNINGLEFINLKTNNKKFVFLDSPVNKITITSKINKDIIVDRYYDFEEKADDLLDLFKFNILQFGDELHATSVLTLVVNNKLYICIINSGEGIDENKKIKSIEINGIKYYSPHFCYLICDDTTNTTKLVQALKSIIAVCYFPIIYNNLQVQHICGINDEIKYCMNYENIELLTFIINNCDGVGDIEFGTGKLIDLLRMSPITLYNTDNMFDKYITDSNIIQSIKYNKHEYFVFNNYMGFRKTLYNMFCNMFIDKYVDLKINSTMIPAFKINMIPAFKINIDEIRYPSTLNNMILEKMIFHINESEIYIIPQEGGSCTWYSMYWPLLMYDIYYNPQPTLYKKFIKDINKTFQSIVEKIFSLTTYTDVFPTGISNLWMMYYDKFCNIGLLSKKTLELYGDFLFNSTFEIDIKTIDFNEYIHNTKNFTNEYLKQNISKIKNINSDFISQILNSSDLSNPKIFIENIHLLIEDKDSLDNRQINTILLFYNILFNQNKNFFKNDSINIKKDIITEMKNFFSRQKNKNKNIKLNEIINKYNTKLVNWYTYLNNLNNKNSYDIYSFYSFATLYQENTTEINSLAQFICYSFAVSNIYLEIFNLFFELKNIKDFNYNVDIARLCNQFLTTLFANEITLKKIINFFPINSRELDDFFVNKKKDTFIKFKSNYLKIHNAYNFQVLSKIKLVKNKTYDEFLLERQFFYENPEYIYSSFTNIDNEAINNDSFVRININDIIKTDNLPYRKNLIRFFGKKFTMFLSIKSKEKELFYTLENLHLLIFGIDVSISSDKATDENNLLKYYSDNNTNLDFYDKLSKMLKTHGIIKFPEYLADNFNEITETYIDLVIKRLKKSYTNVTKKIRNKNIHILIDNNSYNILNSSTINHKNKFLKYFTTSKYPDVLFNTSYKSTSDVEFIILQEDYIFKITGIQTSNILKINNIFVNNYSVLKLSEINFPFKYSLPITCKHLFFKKDSTFNVLYFIKPIEIDKKNNLLETIDMENEIIEFTINENTMLYPKIVNNKSLINFSKMCKFYQTRPLNIFFTNQKDTKLNLLFKFTDKDYFKKEFEPISINNVILMNSISETPPAVVTIKKVDYTKFTGLINISNSNLQTSFNKLMQKIEMCRIIDLNKDKTLGYLNCLLSNVLNEQTKLINFYKNAIFYELFDYRHLNFMLLTKISNTINQLISLIDNEDLFCSQLKILRELYNTRKLNPMYNFEFVFEIISGYELLDEQQTRYLSIISNYKQSEIKPTDKLYTTNITKIINYNQNGGHIYPLHHFMMGKGKSSVMTPLLTLYFILIHDKYPMVIVPEHLVSDTKSIIEQYMYIFDLNNYCEVVSDSQIKHRFLDGEFNDPDTNTNKIFIIDEFDSLLDPTKSNFNIVKEKSLSVLKLYQLIYQFVLLIKKNNLRNITIDNLTDIVSFIKYDFSDNIIENVINEINQTLQNILSGSFMENIHWGIDKNKYYAVPYLNKDKPILNSNFSSSVLTIFLTLYYYVILGNFVVSDLVIQFVINNNYYIELFNTKEPSENIGEHIIILCQNSDNLHKLFNKFFYKIFANLKLPKVQSNTSFVDILNIDSIYKIGYSGTVNITLPDFSRTDDLFYYKNIIVDTDEIINVTYALIEAKTILINEDYKIATNLVNLYIDKINQHTLFAEYGAFIDQVGIFKNILNKDVAQIFNVYFDKTRDIIFMSESDIKLVLSGDNLQNYNSSTKYKNPFIYYSQGHIVGVDIRQDYLPQLKGLVTINTKSTYTNVAQSIFRLRKINLGHTIDIIFINNPQEISDIKISTSIDVYNLIKCNDEKQKINKYDLLIYQTLKSEVRKLKYETDKTNKNFNKIYTEKIKYYYIDSLPDKPEDYLDDILDYTKLKQSDKNKTEHLFSQINTINQLNKLVFNIGTDVQEISIGIATATETTKIKVSTLTEAIESSRYIPDNYSYKPIEFDYFQYYFDNINVHDIFYRVTIQINNFLHCVPNICIQFNGINFTINQSGLVFVLMEQFNKLLLIPGYMAPYFYKTNVLLQVNNFQLLNLNQIEKFTSNKERIDCFSTKPMIKFITSGTNYDLINKKTDELTDKENYELFILKVILLNFTNKNENHKLLIKKVGEDQKIKFNNYIKELSNNRYRNQIIIPPFTFNKEQKFSIDPFIKIDDQYRCEKYQKSFNDNYIKVLNNCEKNKKEFNRRAQSIADKEKDAKNKKEKLLIKQQQETCENNKLIYNNLIICEQNKEYFNNTPNIELCRKYKINYFDSIKIQTDIKNEEELLETNNSKLTKYNNKLFESDSNIIQKKEEKKCLENKMNTIDLSTKISSKQKQKQKNKILISNIDEEIKNLTDNIDKYKKKIAKYEQNITVNKKKINHLQTQIEILI